ncbi:alcohol dehydrogenase catalytic domain-containing protein, partial [Sphaerotilus montanus]|uniref:alcohol dehydrogenase catalytic domain-containing protein n=1 Tax=Sphaerotilus montanus TaxID=522889 RepID=UPI003FA3078A
DLHVTEGDQPVHRAHVTPGHEVVGRVVGIGPNTPTPFAVGDLVGVPWLAGVSAAYFIWKKAQDARTLAATEQ